mgnify:CR=1 FL=1
MDNIKEIVKHKLNKLKNKYNKKDIILKINSNVIEDIINMSNYKEFGARKIEKIIKNDIESIIINDYETWLTVRHPDYYYEYKNIFFIGRY